MKKKLLIVGALFLQLNYGISEEGLEAYINLLSQPMKVPILAKVDIPKQKNEKKMEEPKPQISIKKSLRLRLHALQEEEKEAARAGLGFIVQADKMDSSRSSGSSDVESVESEGAIYKSGVFTQFYLILKNQELEEEKRRIEDIYGAILDEDPELYLQIFKELPVERRLYYIAATATYLKAVLKQRKSLGEIQAEQPLLQRTLDTIAQANVSLFQQAYTKIPERNRKKFVKDNLGDLLNQHDRSKTNCLRTLSHLQGQIDKSRDPKSEEVYEQKLQAFDTIYEMIMV